MNTGNETDLSNYVANGEWDLVEARVERNVVFYSCCQVNLSQKQTLANQANTFQEPYPDVTYHFILRRRPLFYGKGTKRKFQALTCRSLILSFQVVLVFFLEDLQILTNGWRVYWAGYAQVGMCVGIII